MLLIIFDKLGSVDVLYSLFEIDKLSIELSDGQISTIDSDKLHRLCAEICDHIQIMTLEITSIKCILLRNVF
ncbi:unnamed protein product [Adineta steineri]|uniref:Uncharacterized protein n=1 Tax=Adineta steineri TaxID=433720 RepID=A0A814V5D9_9BILA|nr:unnamed protein product [Adineta steineri]CAF1183585.1 unnamed protein product [Adineta steineri]CAF3763548.1 unnamed protein product [Adineta steineri]CAF4287150.1 unnamed protein product [Adineta steineri]